MRAALRRALPRGSERPARRKILEEGKEPEGLAAGRVPVPAPAPAPAPAADGAEADVDAAEAGAAAAVDELLAAAPAVAPAGSGEDDEEGAQEAASSNRALFESRFPKKHSYILVDFLHFKEEQENVLRDRLGYDEEKTRGIVIGPFATKKSIPEFWYRLCASLHPSAPTQLARPTPDRRFVRIFGFRTFGQLFDALDPNFIDCVLHVEKDGRTYPEFDIWSGNADGYFRRTDAEKVLAAPFFGRSGCILGVTVDTHRADYKGTCDGEACAEAGVPRGNDLVFLGADEFFDMANEAEEVDLEAYLKTCAHPSPPSVSPRRNPTEQIPEEQIRRKSRALHGGRRPRRGARGVDGRGRCLQGEDGRWIVVLDPQGRRG